MTQLGGGTFLIPGRSEPSRLRSGGRPTFVFGGEVHYFRIDRARWADRVAAARALGLNTIASYVPWIWHEPSEGSFDLSGTTHPQRDLSGFVRLVEDAGLLFLPRIGPVSNAELTGEGLPTWLFERYPEAQLRREDGSSMAGVPSYRHPLFLEKVARWYEALLPILVPHTVPRGGAIPFVQLCNEIDMPTWLARQGDHHEHVQRRWLEYEQRDARQPDGSVGAWPSPRHTRWMEFYADYFAGYVKELRALARERGLDVPVMVNLAQWTDHHDRGRGIDAPLTATMFRDVTLGTSDVIVGGDYYPRRLDYDNFHDVVIATEVVRMISAPDAPVVCPELQAGGNEDRPRVYGSDLELLLHLSAGHGLNAVNAYMLAGGENPPGLGVFGKEHDWQAPIGPDGTLRPNAEALRRFGAFLSTAPGFAATRKRFDTHFGFYAPYFQTEYLKGDAIAALTHRRVEIAQDGILRLLALANVQCDFVDLTRARPLARCRTLIVFSEDWMDANTQTELAGYLRGGGSLALFPTVPTCGAAGEPCTILADALDARPSSTATRFIHAGTTTLPMPPMRGAQTFAARPGDEVLATTDGGAPCVLARNAGDGRALLVGFGMRHRFERQVALLRAWCERIGVRPHLELQPGDVVGVTRDDGQSVYLTAFNFHEEERQVRGTIRWNGATRAIAPRSLGPRSAATWLALETPCGARG